jgi:hypothetical protein
MDNCADRDTGVGPDPRTKQHVKQLKQEIRKRDALIESLEVVTSPPQLQSNRWGNAIGDLTISAAKTFVHESGWVPPVLVGRAPTGPLRTNGVPMKSGFNRLTFSVTALKRQDPLLFVATGGYTKAFEANHPNPGNHFNFTTGAFLATSPETTLRTVLS